MPRVQSKSFGEPGSRQEDLFGSIEHWREGVRVLKDAVRGDTFFPVYRYELDDKATKIEAGDIGTWCQEMQALRSILRNEHGIASIGSV